MPATIPCLWFDGTAEQAAETYIKIFPNSVTTSTTRYPSDTPGEAGTVMTVELSLDGQPYTLLNGGPQFPFTEAVSFQIMCADQDEIDHYWDGLTADGGQESMCGWLKDRFGVSWQVVTPQMVPLLNDPDPARSQRAMQAVMGMKKLDIAEIMRAADADPA